MSNKLPVKIVAKDPDEFDSIENAIKALLTAYRIEAVGGIIASKVMASDMICVQPEKGGRIESLAAPVGNHPQGLVVSAYPDSLYLRVGKAVYSIKYKP